LIQGALKSGGRLELLDDILGGKYWFVSDEIALNTASEKVVADLLLVRVDAGMACLVNAELKTGRLMETFKQVICFRKALEHPDLQKDWKTFAEVMTGQKFRWHPSQETRGVVIWPAIGENPMKALANEKRKDYARVDVIGYRDVPEINNYTLEFEKLAEKA
jgi:methenyltetrahydromethanopterin cyclohydrolase